MDNELKEMLLEIKSTLKEQNVKFDEINQRLEKLESNVGYVRAKQDRDSRKLADLQLDVRLAERNIRRDIYNLNDEMDTVIEVLKQNDMIPR